MIKLRTTLIAAFWGLIATFAQADGGEDFAIMWMGQIHEGIDHADVDDLIAEVSEIVSENEGTLLFEISRVGDRLFGYERFADIGGMVGQLEKVGPHYPRINEAWVPVTVVPTTAIPDEVAKILEGYGALIPDRFASAAH